MKLLYTIYMREQIQNERFDTIVETLIDRINDFQTGQVWLGITSVSTADTDYCIVKNPKTLRGDLSEDPDSFSPVYAFTKHFPTEAKRIFDATRGEEIILTIEATLDNSGMLYVVICNISEVGIKNIEIRERDKISSFKDLQFPRIYNDFFIGED